ncbi:transporter associated domain-containing protein, partial [Pantoea septica]|uniref:transporter associated domain-containing protein n=1 Tax=Pantoea septica TaxID=472695 RepID=UPI002896AA13
EVVQQNDGSVLVEGSANVREINKAFNWHLPEQEARTINGMLLEALEEIPEINTRVELANYAVDILDVQDNMVKQVRITPQTPLKSSVGS